MRLQHIDARMWDRVPVDLAIEDRGVVVLGENAAGKTSVLQAITLGLSGPPRGPYPITFHTRLQWDGAPLVARSVGQGVHQVTYRNLMKVKAAGLAIAEDFGSAWIWSGASFLELSGKERASALSSILNLSWSRDQVREALAQHDLTQEELHDLTGPHPWQRLQDGQYYLDRLIEGLRTAWTETNRAIAEERASSEGAAKRLAEAERPSGTVASWRARIAEIDDQIGVLRGKIGVQLGQTRGRTLVEDGLKRARAALDQAEGAAHGGDLSNLWVAMEEAETALAARKAASKAATARWNETGERQRELQEQERQAVAARDELIATQTGARAISTLELQPMLEWVAANGPEEHSSAAVALLALQMDEDALVAVDQQLHGLRGQLVALGSLRDRHISAMSAADVGMSQAEETARRAKAAHSIAVIARDAARKRIPELAAEIEKLETELAGCTNASVVGMEKQISALQEEWDVAMKAQDTLNDLAMLEQQQMGAAGRIQDLQDRRDRTRVAGKAVRSVRGQMLADSTAPLAGPASQITRHVLGEEVEIVFTDDSAHVHLGGRPLQQRSQSETVLALCALQVAVQATLPGWKAVLMDGLEVIEQDRRTAFVEALGMMDGIDNYILTCVTDGWVPPADVQVLKLERT